MIHNNYRGKIAVGRFLTNQHHLHSLTNQHHHAVIRKIIITIMIIMNSGQLSRYLSADS